MLKINSILYRMSLGVTNPYLIQCSDGNKYVAKFPGNPEGTKVLINEYVSARLASYLNLPIPNFCVVDFDASVDYSENDDNIFCTNGSVFCSQYLEKSSPVPDYYILTKVNNRLDALKILFFDVLIGNNDRNPGNLLIDLKNNLLVMIDHSHVFINGAIWDANSLNWAINSPIDISSMFQPMCNMLIQCSNFDKNYDELKEFIKRVKNIDSNILRSIFQDVPDDWNFRKEDRDALENFILNRIERVNEICSLLKVEGAV